MLEASERKHEMEEKAEEKISRAKAKLMQLEPFFAMLLFKMPTYPCYQIPSMGTDGTLLLYNPEFVSEVLLRKDVMFVLLHEVMHVFFKHHFRGPIKAEEAKKMFERLKRLTEKGKKDIFLEDGIENIKHKMKEWNFATDYTINGHIIENIPQVPHSKELDPGGKVGLLYKRELSGTTSEKVYDEIKTPYDPDADPGSDDMGMGIGGVLPAGLGELTEGEVKAIEGELDNAVKAAAISAKKAGKLPAGVEGVIEDLYTTTTPWQDILRTVFTSINKQDYTFQYPNKRYTQHMMDYGVVMPSLWGEEYQNVGFIMDTSGSVGEREKQMLASELRHILEDYNIKLHVLYCDTQAYTDSIQIFTKEDIRNGRLKLNVKGGGGTSMRPAFDYYRDNMDEHGFEVVICMSDMYLSDWGRLGTQPAFSTFWLRLPDHSDQKPDFGTCVDIVLEEEK
jgi:predicted metal-dependent peptidase